MSGEGSIEQRVIAAIAKSKRIDGAGIGPQTRFEELGMDSLDAIELLFELEEEFDLTVEDEAVQGQETVGQVIEEVRRAVAAKEPSAGADPE